MVDTGTLVAIFVGLCGVWAAGFAVGLAVAWVRRIRDAV